MKKALITGITGQDGSYLAELLLEHGYEVHGTVRRSGLEDPSQGLSRLEPVLDRIRLHPTALNGIASLIREIQPDECYHLAAQSSVGFSFQDEFSTLATNVGGTHLVLASIKDHCPTCKVYFAGSSEMFGSSPDAALNEESPCRPVSTYGISKLAGRHLTRYYREVHGLFAACGILFNHESPRRGLEFVTRKVSHAAARIALGLQHELRLGNLEARRDWGHAQDYVEAMWLMLQQGEADEFVIATGRDASVRDLARLAFEVVGLDYRDHVVVDERFKRPVDVDRLRGDPSKAKRVLDWQPRVSFEELVEIMVRSDLERLAAESNREGRSAPAPPGTGAAGERALRRESGKSC